ncbi:hypothetical protein [Hymenobacter rigui]|uniref:Uncharacterized protein n=1 Tax=Hymenobacter rigui TaxID=334424 RepID=A0A428KPE2_9BACT|nr:hypothetical protein [Hymenobacter rigui]RSK48316.1 hypothetical protein EI291_11350 [Hymenobacter rigui]
MTITQKILLLGAVCMWGMSQVGYAQQPVPSTHDGGEPIFLLNSTTIINGLVADFNPADIQQVLVYQPSLRSATDSLPSWQATLGTGVIVIESKRQIPAETFLAIGQRLQPAGPLQFALNGHWLSAEATARLRVASGAIAQLYVTYPTASQPATLVDVRLKQMPKKEHPPGSIFIR